MDADAREDELLVGATIAGDGRAYGELTRRHSRRVLANCVAIVGSLEDAEDMAQDAFVRGFLHLCELRDPANYGAWIVRIARNLSHDHARRQKRGRELLERHDTTTEATCRYGELHEALGRLSEKYRVPLLLYYFDGQSSENVGRALNLSAAAVLTRLSRARKELRHLLSAQEERYGLRKRS